jgi:hypothetical protein
MKQTLLLMMAALAFSCTKTNNTTLLPFYRAETQCAERWQKGTYEPGTDAHKETVELFLSDSLGVTVSDLTIVKENDEAQCLACNCVNGYVIRFKSSEEHKAALLAAGFLQQ